MLRVALLGAGRIGAIHAKTINEHKQSQLVYVGDVLSEAAHTLAVQYGAQAKEPEAILADSSIDAILIATSTDTHADLIEAATKHKKAVLCEKPVDLSLERAKACLKASKAHAQPVMLGFNRRFDPNFTALKAALDQGEIGKTELLSVTSFDPAPPPYNYIKVSGGLFRDMMIHDFDICCWLMGGPPQTLSATASALTDCEIGKLGDVDTAVVTLQYADGRIAVIKNSRRAAYGYDQRIELLGSKGLLSAGNVLENTVCKATHTGVCSAKPEHFFLERYARAYALEWAAFVEALTLDKTLPTNLEDGIIALAMAEAANTALHRGKAVSLTEFLA